MVSAPESSSFIVFKQKRTICVMVTSHVDVRVFAAGRQVLEAAKYREMRGSCLIRHTGRMVEELSKRHKIKQVIDSHCNVNYLFDWMKLYYLSGKGQEGSII